MGFFPLAAPAAQPDMGEQARTKAKQTKEATDLLEEYEALWAERSAIETEYDAVRAKAEAQFPELPRLRAEAHSFSERIVAMENQVKSAVRRIKAGIQGRLFRVAFTDPQSESVDAAKLLALLPAAAGIQGLFSQQVNIKQFDAAVAAGLIPEAVAKAVKGTVATTQAGRVELKRL